MSIERFLATNLAADFVLLACVSRSMGLFNWRRLLAADAICAGLAALAALRPTLAMPVALIAPAAAALVITHRAAPRLWSVFVVALVGQALLSGGIASLAPLAGPPAAILCLGAGGLLCLFVSAGRPPGPCGCQVSLCVLADGRYARFPALIDTGNRLREPVSGLPVLIAEATLIRAIMPKAGYRTLCYGGLGGEGRMACFRPDALWIVRGPHRRRGPDVWVAVSPTPLPGLCQALAPPEFALYYR